MYPFERFTEKAKKTLMLAQEEAERSHHSYIGTEHLLLALLRQEDTIAVEVLRELGIEIAAVRETIAHVIGREERVLIQQIIPTSRVKKVIEVAFEEATRRGQQFVGPEHMLAALVIEGEGIAAHVLADLGATRAKVMTALGRKWSLDAAVVSRRPKFPPRPAEMRTVTRFRVMPQPGSDAEALLRLLTQPELAALLRARGLDAAKLGEELSRPPDEVLNLRQHLVSARTELADAASHQDYERAARLQKRVDELITRLQRAEALWFRSLGR
ncbi:MAG TPA: Clp protease N-terminal domain-containing protein [Candidatus Dormibacteraeota bacterium]|nr:Clp protease N-terminal domain-containing protein [Candidatus Dormibacteraeota bacterium]